MIVGKMLLEHEAGLHSYLCRAADVESAGLLRECVNKQSCQSFPSVLTGISTGSIIRLD